MAFEMIQQLRKKLSENQIVFDSDFVQSYRSDKSNIRGAVPLAVVKPDHSDQIAFILQLAYQKKISVVPRGGGTGTTAGSVPMENSIVMSFEKMNRILELDTENRIVVVEPGVITGEIHKLVESKGLFYPPDPGSLDDCMIGGNVAENASGPRGLKYGVTRDYVVGLEGFWADGSPFKLGGKIRKNVAGYDLMQLLIGSEGTLAVITKIYLRLLRYPSQRRLAVAVFNNRYKSLRLLSQIYEEDIQPSLAEFFDGICMDAVNRYLKDNQTVSSKDFLIFEIDGMRSNEVDKEFERLIMICRENGASEVRPIQTPLEMEKIWKIRRSISPALKVFGLGKISHDIVVPVAKVAEYMDFLDRLHKKSGLLILGYGHLGDGNLHVNVIKEKLTEKKWVKWLKIVELEILKTAVDMGGSISGEHGIGLTKKPFLSLQFSHLEMELMRKIKRAFDPRMILNPGKIIDS